MFNGGSNAKARRVHHCHRYMMKFGLFLLVWDPRTLTRFNVTLDSWLALC